MNNRIFLYAMVVCTVIVAVSLFGVATYGKTVEPETLNGWHYDDAPDNVPIIGVWGLGYATQARVCVMIHGQAYDYDDWKEPVRMVMPVRPRKWRGLEE